MHMIWHGSGRKNAIMFCVMLIAYCNYVFDSKQSFHSNIEWVQFHTPACKGAMTWTNFSRANRTEISEPKKALPKLKFSALEW